MDCPSRGTPVQFPWSPISPPVPSSPECNAFDTLRGYYEEKLSAVQNELREVRANQDKLTLENVTLKEERDEALTELEAALQNLAASQEEIARKCRERNDAREESQKLRSQLLACQEDMENWNKVQETCRKLSDTRFALLKKNLNEEFLSYKRRFLLDLHLKMTRAVRCDDQEAWYVILEHLEAATSVPELLSSVSPAADCKAILELKIRKEDEMALRDELIRQLEVDCQRLQVRLESRDAEVNQLTSDLKKLHKKLGEADKKIKSLQQEVNTARVPKTPKIGTARLMALTPQLALSAAQVFLNETISTYPRSNKRHCSNAAGRRSYDASVIGMEEMSAVDEDTHGNEDDHGPPNRRIKLSKEPLFSCSIV